MRKTDKYLSLVFLLSCSLFYGQIRTPHTEIGASLIKFTENKHQWDDFIKYRAQLDGGALYVQKDALIYSFYDKETYRSMHANTRAKPTRYIKTTGFKVSFENSNPGTSIESDEPTRDYCNYFLGKDPSRWAGNVKNYQRLLYNDLWQNINLEMLGQDNSVKYNFYVKPGADVADIKLYYDKVEKISIHRKELIIKTTLNEMVEHEPYAYQIINGETITVPCNFELKKNTVSFSFPKGYNKEYELVIDPVLVFACSSGSTADNFGMTATYDSTGNLYSGGTCFANGFPTVNPYDGTFNGVVTYGMTDVVVTKYDSSGTFLHYSTYIGGAGSSEIVTSLIIDHQNNLFLYGATGSADFPMAGTSFDNTFNGGDSLFFMFNGTYFHHGTDIYIAKLSAGGNNLLASTYIGGSHNDGVNTNNIIASYLATLYNITVNGEYPPDSLQYNYGDQYRGEIQLDKNDDPVICSSTRSANFPTANAFDVTLGGWQDAVVFKFDKNLSVLKWSSFLGGSNNDAGYALYIANNNEVYATGGTRSPDFPTSPGSYQPNYNGGKCDGYIAKISANGQTLMKSTFIGTPLYDQSYFIQLDNKQNAYVYGQSLGSMPVLNAGFSSPNGKQFVSKLDSSLSTLSLSTVFGNGQATINLSPAAFLVDCSENIFFSGWGGNIIMGPPTFNMPLTTNAHQSANPDGFNFYLMVLSKNAQSLVYGTYFGGPQSKEHVDGGTSRFDKKGFIYQSVCAGCGGHSDFPVTPGSWPTSVYGNHWNQSTNCNNGTFKFKFDTYPHASLNTNQTSGCVPLTVQFTNNSVSYTQYLWNLGGGAADTSSLILNPIKIYTTPGTYTVTLLVKNDACFFGYDTTKTIITVYPKIITNFNFVKNKCGNTFQFTDSSYALVNIWHWNFGDGVIDSVKNPAHSYTTPGTYTITLVSNNQFGCKDSIKKVVTIFGFNPISVSANVFDCAMSPIQLNASGGIAYQWSPPASLSNSTIYNPVATPTVTTQYTIAITQVAGVDTCISILHTNVNVPAYTSTTLSAFAHPDTIYSGQTTQLGSLAPGGSIVWNPNYNISDIHNSNPTAWPGHTTTYTAVYTDSHGCSFPISGVTVYVLAKDCNENTVFVPNTFTPNADGMNDVMYARSNLVTEIHFVIADRWGQIVFETNDITKGWDGNFNGKPCNPDVFGYYITYKCNNGKDSFKKGNITLIR